MIRRIRIVEATIMSFDPIARTPSAYAYPLLIKQLLHTPLRHAPRQEIVYRDLLRYDYLTLRERIGRLASALAALGVEPGETVAIMDWDSHRYLECYFAVPMMGAVLQTVNVRLSPEQVQYTMDHAGADVVLVNSEFLPLLEQIKPGLARVRRYVLLDDLQSQPDPAAGFAGEYEALLAAAAPDYVFPDFDENTRATTFYTTGTTGLPKGVYFSHRQIVLHTLSLTAGLALQQQQGRLHRDDVYMPITPMFHVHAWGMPFVATLAGVKQVYPGRYTPESVLALRAKEKVTFSHCVPTILHMVLSCPYAQTVDLNGWKMVFGGSAMPRALAQLATERGIDLIGGYGMSETCPVLTLAQVKTPLFAGGPDQVLDLRTRGGLPIPLVDLRTVDPDMADVAHDGVTAGEVVVRAPWLTQGYFRNPEASEQLWAGGYLHTNDIGTIDAEGYLRITDRLKDVIKTGGEWVSSIALEDIVARHPAVSEVAVIGVKDERWGERPIAIVVRKAGESVEADQLRAHVKTYADSGAISKFAIPDQILFVDALEKTSVGKLDKKLLRQKYA
jgi:fatty-acyl-CoA synthase